MKNINRFLLFIMITAFTVFCSKDVDDDNTNTTDNSCLRIGMFSVSGSVSGDFTEPAVFDEFIGLDRVKIYDLENYTILTLIPENPPAMGEFEIEDIFDGEYYADFEYFLDGNPDNEPQYFSDQGTKTITIASESEIKGEFEFSANNGSGGVVDISGHSTPFQI